MVGKALDARILMVDADTREVVGVSAEFDFPVASIMGTSIGAALGSSIASCLAKRIVIFTKATDKTAREVSQQPQPIPEVIPGTPSSTSSSPQRKEDPILCPNCGASPLTSVRKIAMRKPKKKSGAIRRVLPPRKNTRRKSQPLRLARAGRIATALAVSGLYNNFNIEDKRCLSTMKWSEPRAAFVSPTRLTQGLLTEMRRPVLFPFKSKPVVWRKAVSKMIMESLPFTYVPPASQL